MFGIFVGYEFLQDKNMNKMESKNKIINQWLLDWVLFEAFEEFKKSFKVENIDRDLIQAIIRYHTDQTDEDVVAKRKVHLLVLLCKLTDGEEFSTKYENFQGFTVLEEVIEALEPVIDTEEFKYHQIMADLKQQAVYVCCRGNDYETAEGVFKRQWSKPRNKTEKTMKSAVSSVLKSKKSNHVQLIDNTYAGFCSEFVKLMEPQDNEEPFLLMQAAKAVIENKDIMNYDVRACGTLLKKLREQCRVTPDSSSQEVEQVVEKRLQEVQKNKEKYMKKLSAVQSQSDEDEEERDKGLPPLSISKTSTPRAKKKRHTENHRGKETNSRLSPVTSKKIKNTDDSSDSGLDELQPLPKRMPGSSVLKKPGVDMSVSFSDSDSELSDQGRTNKARQKNYKPTTNKRDKDGFLEPALPAPRYNRLASSSSVSNLSMMSTTSSRAKNPWNKSETEALYQGVKAKGIGKWVDIKKSFNFSTRTNIQLKDRWRSMHKDKTLILSLAAKYGPLTS